MAKKFNPKNALIQFRHDGAKWRLRFTSYPNDPEDTVDTTIEYKRLGGDEGPRDFTARELTGTLQAFLDSCDTTYKATEKIA